MIRFEYPELFLVVVPAGFLYWKIGRTRGVTGWLRAAILLLLVFAMTGPLITADGRGMDVILVADRSRSLPAGAHDNIRELIDNVQTHVATRGTGDRVCLVTFGAQPQVEYEFSEQNRQTEYARQINPDGSDLHEAILTALDRVNPNRPARILVLSDGESNGPDPRIAARRAREQDVPIDCRGFERISVGDVAVESVLLPESVGPREPFQYSVWVYADSEKTGTVSVLRDGLQIASQERVFKRGMNRFLFRDILEESGFYNYTVELGLEQDPIAENNRGAGVVRVDGGPRVLVLNTDGQTGNLKRALDSARIPADVAIAKTHPLTQDSLDQYRAVILENVPAGDLGRVRMQRLAQFVDDLGGGLLLTGGKGSFGTGGYFKSPLDDVLPVSMELREEHRKMRVAMAVVLDRSGSMSAAVSGAGTKMDLANLGTAECISLLSPADMIAVIAVDSAPHVVIPLQPVESPQDMISRVRSIQSQGGGIFIDVALTEAGKQLTAAAGYSTRHIILFSDAQDSEQPGNYRQLLRKFSDSSITVSVIGLGTEHDSDAELLKDIAKLGNGNIMFTSDAQELPRLFTQDTMAMARNTFIVAAPDAQPDGISGRFLPDARLMGNLGSGGFPPTGGYNLSYLKPDAMMGVVSQDEYTAPWSAFWYRGIGRVAAITLEMDGQYSGAFGQWDDYENFVVTHARWLLGGTDSQKTFVDMQQQGQEAVVSVELDPDRADRDTGRPPELIVVPPGVEREQVLKPDFVWTGPNSLEARFQMNRTGSYRTLVKTGSQEFVRGPAVTLPYSPEFAPRSGLPDGRETLVSLTELSGGILRTGILEIFDDPPKTLRRFSLLGPVMILALVLLITEIAGRRLALWEQLKASPAPQPVSAAASGANVTDSPTGWLSGWTKMWAGVRPSRKAAGNP
ncbi:MAG: vWA domain-containing protein, partial [Planctomycetaceae bacterium]